MICGEKECGRKGGREGGREGERVRWEEREGVIDRDEEERD